MKGEINSNTIIVGDFNTQLTPIDTSTKQKISEATQTLKDGMDQLDLIDIYRIFHPKPMNFTFFSSAHGTFARTDLISSHKSRLYILKKSLWKETKKDTASWSKDQSKKKIEQIVNIYAPNIGAS